ncbi:ROK family transcriptional regulator [Streptomyces sp. NPDC005962]|uniref:ROK family transcriptional regulator n=1 Tax=Streptomyces sp. NPDC005962 TaxID=3154466 RepID=UPI0034072D35
MRSPRPMDTAWQRTGAPQSRRKHENLILGLLRKHGPLTRGELGERCGLSRTTLYDVVGALMDSGAVSASVPRVGGRGRGRPAEKLSSNPWAADLLGIDFARQAVRVAAMTTVHGSISSASEPHGPDASWEERLDVARRLTRALTGGTLRLDTLSGVGVGVTGPVGPLEDDSPGAIHPETVSALVSESFGIPARLDSNTRLATLAERTWGAAIDEQDVLYLSLSHSVGGGLVVGGTLHRGAHGLSGQFGHITVDPGGEPCACGRVGCLETVASIGAVLDAHGSAADVPQLVAALEAGDRAAHSVLERAGTHVGRVLADLCNAFGPSVVVLGGELTGTGPALMNPLRRELDANVACRGSRMPLHVRPAKLGDVGAALGALALLLHRQSAATGRPVPLAPAVP